jgi:hypothetical protein
MKTKITWRYDYPSEPGYYLTFYYNHELKECLYKALYWTGYEWKWRCPIIVQGYLAETRNDYYCPCVSGAANFDFEPFPGPPPWRASGHK